VEGIVNRQKINRFCANIPVILSWTACVWVLGIVAGGARSGDGEGLGFHIFWLLILAQAPFVVGYAITADWRRWRGAAGMALQVAALVLAFAPVAYFRL
jgi:hypothetical protein